MSRKSKELSSDKTEVIVKVLKNDGLKISETLRMLGVQNVTCRLVIKTF